VGGLSLGLPFAFIFLGVEITIRKSRACLRDGSMITESESSEQASGAAPEKLSVFSLSSTDNT
jgi:hypothetical protein